MDDYRCADKQTDNRFTITLAGFPGWHSPKIAFLTQAVTHLIERLSDPRAFNPINYKKYEVMR